MNFNNIYKCKKNVVLICCNNDYSVVQHYIENQHTVYFHWSEERISIGATNVQYDNTPSVVGFIDRNIR